MTLRDIEVEQVGKAVYLHCTSPKALYVTLVDRWWVLAIGCFVGAAFGCLLIKATPKQFVSQGRLLLFQKLPTFMDESTRVPDPKAYDSLFATHVQLMGSPVIVEKAVEKYDLADLTEIDEMHAGHRRLGKKTVGEMIRDNLKVGRAGSGDSDGAFVLSISFKHKSAKECPQVVEAILKTYQSHVNNSILDDQHKAVELMERLQLSLNLDITQKERQYRDFLKRAPGVWDQTTKTNSHHKRVEAFEEELTDLEIKRETVISRIAMFRTKNDPNSGRELTDLERLALVDDIHLPRLDVLISLTDNNNVRKLHEQYPELQEVASAQYDDYLTKLMDLSKLSREVGKKHPKFIDAEAELDVLQKQILKSEENNNKETSERQLKPADLVNAYEVLLSAELKNLNERIEFINRRISEELSASIRLQDFSIQADRLKESYEKTHELSIELFDKMQKQSVLNQFGSYVAEIIEYPKKGQLVWPKKPVILVLGTICGLFASTFIAFVLDLIEETPLRERFGFLPSWLIRNDIHSTVRSPGR